MPPSPPVREKLLRRLSRLHLCAARTIRDTQCMNTPAVGSQFCREHAPATGEPKAGSVLLDILKSCLSPADAAAIEDVYTYGPVSLEDLIALHRLRINDLERRYRDGFVSLAQYGVELRALTEQVRKLTESNSKIALNDALSQRNTAPEAEAFNPFAHIPPPPKQSDASGGE